MLHGEGLGLFLGAIALGAVHGIEPGHGWPVAASYALDKSNTWLYGFAASLIIGIGHLISSIAMVGVFFYAKAYFDLTQVNEPLTVFGGVQIGGPVSLVAGVLLIVLGIREYVHGHTHGTHGGTTGGSHTHHDHSHTEHEHGPTEHDHPHTEHEHSPTEHDHPHTEHDHSHTEHQNTVSSTDRGLAHEHELGHGHGHSHEADDGGVLSRVTGFLPFGGGSAHGHGTLEEATDRGLLGIAWFAFLLGFAHEEEFEIIALCAGSNYCLELMSAYAVTVIVGIVGLTLLLIAGYHRCEERVETYTPYLPAFAAVVLVSMGIGFITGLF